MLKTLNKGCEATGLSQAEFASSVEKSNSVFGKYLSSLENVEKASEVADESFDKAKSDSDITKEKIKSLDQLIQRYEDLAELGINDADTRQQSKDIQDQIVDLVGEQAKNLALVNGKLDDELDRL